MEDADQDQLVDIYSWIYIANIMVGFVAPLAGLLIGAFSLIPTVRGLYIFAAIMFTIKAILTYQMTQETQQGVIRMQETRHQNIFHALGEYSGIFQGLLRTPQTLYTAGIMLIHQHFKCDLGKFLGHYCDRETTYPSAKPGDLPICQISSDVGLFLCQSCRASTECTSNFQWRWVSLALS